MENNTSSSPQLSSNERLSFAFCTYVFMQAEMEKCTGLHAVLFLGMLGKQIEGEVEPCSIRYIHNEMRLHWSGYPEVMH